MADRDIVMGLRALTKRAIVAAGRLVPGRTPRSVVLCYHSVHPMKPLASATVELFKQHLAWLNEHCVMAPFADVAAGTVADQPEGPPIVAVTFDDGYDDNYDYAFPLLTRYGVPATFFITAGLVEKDPAVLARFQELRHATPSDVRPLEWLQVQEMGDGGMDIGAHTYSHPNLARLERTEAEVELRRSKEVIEDRLGRSIRSMAYPFGKPRRHFTPTTMELAAAVGYEYAAAVACRPVSASHSRYAIPRFYVTGDSVQSLRDKICGAWDLLGMWQERAPAFLQR